MVCFIVQSPEPNKNEVCLLDIKRSKKNRKGKEREGSEGNRKGERRGRGGGGEEISQKCPKFSLFLFLFDLHIFPFLKFYGSTLPTLF